MRRRTRSPKGSGGAAGGTTRGGRGRGRARGGAKGKTGGRGSGGAGNKASRSNSPIDNDCVNIIVSSKDNQSSSSHFSRQPNGAVLQLGGIPRRPTFSNSASSSASNNNNNSSNAVNLNNGGPPPPPGSDYYLHKKFKKVTATVEPEPTAGSSSSSSTSSSNSTAAASGMVYKPKFRIKSDLEVAAEQESSNPVPLVTRESGDDKSTAVPPPVNLSVVKPVCTVMPVVAPSPVVQTEGLGYRGGNSLIPTQASTRFVPHSPPIVSGGSNSCSSIPSTRSSEPAKISKDMRLDRKSLDERISKLIDENQSILEWPEQFTKMLKNHTSRGSSGHSHQRASHLLSGGSTVELPLSSSSAHMPLHSQSTPNGFLRHHSSSNSCDGMPTSGGSVELINSRTSSPQLHASSSLLNSNGLPVAVIGRTPSTPVLPTDLSFGAHSIAIHNHLSNGNSGGGVISTVIPSPSASPVLSSSTSATTSTTSSMVPKKRRRLSPTPSRLCGGEVSELSVRDASGVAGTSGKGFFQDVDMTVRVSNCGTSGAKVTIRTNNGTISGGSVVAGTSSMDYSKMIETSSPHISKPNNSSIFFPGPGPSSPVPLSLVNTSSKSIREKSLSPARSAAEPKPKSPRGRPAKKKCVPETVSTTTSPSPSSSLLRLAVPAEIPSRPSSIDRPSSTPLSLLSPAALNHSPRAATVEPIMKTSPSPPTPTPQTPTKSENAHPSSDIKSSGTPTNKEGTTTTPPFSVVPTSTQNPKRPTFLALKPVNTNSKKTEPGVLPSPETPRVAKPYNQMTINGQAYTYLGFKVSTRSSYTCLFKTQPMFIPQDPERKLSMYSNWQPRPRDPSLVDIGISTNDSRVNGRKSPHHIIYTSALGKGLDTLTVSSPDNQAPITSPICEDKTFLSGIPSASSNEQATKPIKVQVSPSSSVDGGIVPISPPSSSSCSPTYSSAVTSYVVTSSSNPIAVGSSGGLVMSMASALSPNPIMATSFSKSKQRKDTGGSDTSSAEECGGRRRSSSSSGKRYPGGDQEDYDTSNMSSDGPLALTSKSGLTAAEKEHRVRIMEGGFESNEDYTYVRGRGRGRYVCEACGIRCKKPSMLRKHLKTHTDLRPYTCKLCNFSFKTKGNLTKHQKSKSHHKKCAGLGIHPESSTSLAMTGPGAFAVSDANTTDDNESDDDLDEDDNGEEMDEGTDSQEEVDPEEDSVVTSNNGKPVGSAGGSESFEKEIAQSLLDLSKATTFQPRIASQGSASLASSSDYESGDGRAKGKRVTYPFNAVIEDISNSSVGSAGGAEPLGTAAPIDLSVKPTTQSQVFEPSSKRVKLEHKNGLVRAPMVVKEAEKWEPPEDEDTMMGISSSGSGARCLNLTKVLNSSAVSQEDSSNSEIMSATIRIPEVKTEVVDYPEPYQQQSRSMFAGLHPPHQRQRTESETSSCSSLGGAASLRASGRTPPLMTSQQQHQAGSSGSGGLKLHQPWLSPSEPKEKKVEPIEITPVNHVTATNVPSAGASQPPAIEIKPVTVSPVSAAAVAAASTEVPNKFNKFVVAMDESSNGLDAAVKEGAPSHPTALGDSPNSKFFAGLSAASLKPQAEFRQPSGPQALVKDEGKAECNVCGKTFARASQLTLHMNIHYIERPFRCDPCGVSFRTKGHLIKHRRSSSHDCKVYLTEAWGVANEENPRPFKCPDCKIAFRIHGHLAKHLRSKMHIMRMECLGKLPFGIYFEMEKSGINLNEIDTTDCDMSLVSLQNVARKIYGDQWRDRLTVPVEEPPA